MGVLPMKPHSISRRSFLHLGAGAATAAALGQVPPSRAWAAPPGEPPDRSATAPSAPVAIGRCASYDLPAVTERLAKIFDQIGGVGSLVNGKTVTIKPNITGTPGGQCVGLPGDHTFQAHFSVLLATVDLLRRAGARRFRIVESVFGHLTFEQFLARTKWDFAALQAAGGDVAFEDTHNLGTGKQYSRVKVPWGGYMFASYDLNRAYEETDVYVSLAKLKNHWTAGVTLAIKNSFGITPNSLYGNDAGKENAVGSRGSILHDGSADPPAGVPAELRKDTPRVPEWRVPRVTVDMIGIRPIDLAIIEGVETISGGEGPWVPSLKALQPGLLIAGRNAVCTDAVATAVMGHDPLARSGAKPFPGDNHLQLAAAVGIGTNDPARIEVRGVSVKEARFPFTGPQRFGGGA
jgi:uncharacterized protein (DUF362 family)